jgi:hypothetical protein
MAKKKNPKNAGAKKKPVDQIKSGVRISIENYKIEANGGVEACQSEGFKFLTDRAIALLAVKKAVGKTKS